MQIDLIAATSRHRALLRQLFELYAHDFSPMTGADVDARGMYTPDDFLREPFEGEGFHPFLLRIDGQWAGFAFVGEGSYIAPGVNRHWLMEEFFVMRKYRGRGAGEWFARQLFARFRGVWEVGEIHENTDALHFWRKVIGRYTDGQYEEIVVDNARWVGPVQVFET